MSLAKPLLLAEIFKSQKSKPKRKYIRKSDFKSEKNSSVFEGRMLKV